jgi:replication initiation and membrane attachment protein DnaB
MNILEHSDHPVKKQNIEYFVQLVRISLADDIITNSEMELLYRMGKKFGFTEPEVENLIETTGKSNFIPPYELSARFEQVYDIVRMTLADGVIDKNEMRLASSFAANSGFKENEIPNLLLLLITGIKQGKDQEDLFEAYKKERKF